MSVIELSLLPDQGRETVCLPLLPVLLRIALASLAQTQKYNTQRSFCPNLCSYTRAGPQGNDGAMIDGRGLSSEVEGLTSEVAGLISEVGG
jgi:hypothetical protein